MEDKIAQKEKHYNIQNLRPPWKKGESGNPAGRPKNRDWVKRERMIPEDKVKPDYRVNVAEYDYKNGKFEKKPAGNSKEDITKNGKYIQCKRKWQFKIEQESKYL